ncbi:conserved hypothetical protein [Talaromyces stipitatus ATCC 10500]|uniref:RNase H type-1 domain-containing protein n=1 Tax=Talaromyces stipitatus (strain ATCC 10500 / CBS 375.48 / QM 6759 / NRRL 1006) TaxID=441959 RepID=B8MSZ5_TALSN|nr:uncharacterized protein TSTA_002180 [Talaromyces stipitatus ATCC 10500]EED12151.1 conserved hypothetical protein [Talaromyces stipitatus ATCC 10500]
MHVPVLAHLVAGSAAPQSTLKKATPIAYPHESREDAQARIGAPMGRTKEQAAADFLDFQHTIPGSDIIVFSDGSRLENGHAGGGYVGFQAHHQFLRSSLSFGPGKEVFDGEAEAALAGAQAAVALSTARFATNLWICLDNLEVATRPLSPSTGSSQGVLTPSARFQLRGHSAKGVLIPKAALSEFDGSLDTRKSLKMRRLTSLPKRALPLPVLLHTDLGITTSPKRPLELQLTRLDLGHMIAARTGHGDFADYHERFNHDDAHLLCRCGARKAPLHFFFCHIAKRRAPRPPGPPSEVIPFLLGTTKAAQKLAIWLAETLFFEDICPRRSLLST